MKTNKTTIFFLVAIILAGCYSPASAKIVSPKTIKAKYPLPANNGRIAEEQHLWLKNRQSSSDHYSMTGAPGSCRNGTAGGFGSFGPLTKNDRQEEKYYIAMRWDYADWIEPDSALAASIGKSDSSLTLKSGTNFSKSGYVKIGSEYIRYSSRQGNKLKGLRRGFSGGSQPHNKSEIAKLVYKYKGGQWEKQTRAVNISKSKKKWFKEKKVLVTNERNGKQVVASILESGPAIWTDRVGGLSPEAFDAIDAKNDEKCTFAFVDQDTKLGKVN